jgi:dienelactone hydrolase
VLAATTSALARDTRAQVAWLRARRDIDPARIALVGHSEGANIAPMIAAADPRIAAIVMLAGSGKRGDELLADQLDDIITRDTTLTAARRDAARAQQRANFETINAGGQVPGEPRTVWLREFLAYDPLPTLRRVRQPILVLQGERDRQVTAENAALIGEAAQRAGNADVTVRVLPGLNHLFLPAESGAVSEYPSLPTSEIGADVIGVINDWLVQKLAAGRKPSGS